MPKPAMKRDEPKPPKKPVQSARPVPPGDEEEEEGGPRKRRYLAENSHLPLISVIDDQPTMDLTKELLEEAHELTERQDETAERLVEIKQQLSGIARDWSLPGMRFGKFGLQYSGERTRSSLNKGMLIENGVDPEVIKASYKESKPYVDARFIEFD
jgi:hypothetical protein